MHSTPFKKVFRRAAWPTEEMTYFYVAYAQQLMGVKISEHTRLEWYFEDVFRISIVEGTAQANEHQIAFVWIQLHRPPLWAAKVNTASRTARSWTKAARGDVPPEFADQHFLEDSSESDGRNIRIAFHPALKTWEPYFTFPVQMGFFCNYDSSLAAVLAARGPPLVAPFGAELWHGAGRMCVNCDDGRTAATIHCVRCEASLCRGCDVVLHKSAAVSSHQRLTLCSFPQTTIDRRTDQAPCNCPRQSGSVCVCFSEADVFCSASCRCQALNPRNYNDSEAPPPAQQVGQAATAYFKSQPKRLRPKKERKYVYPADDDKLGAFVTVRGGSKRDRDSDSDRDDE